MPSTAPDPPAHRLTGDQRRATALDPSRRALLLAGGVGLLALGAAACDASPDQVAPPTPQTADERAQSRAADQEQKLAELAEATALRHPTVTLASVAGRVHTAHAQALREGLAASPAAVGSSPPGASTVPTIPAGAARTLAAAELAASREHRHALAQADISGGVARVLASVAASDAAFSRALRDQAADA